MKSIIKVFAGILPVFYLGFFSFLGPGFPGGDQSQILATRTVTPSRTSIPTSTFLPELRDLNPTLNAWSDPRDITNQITENWHAYPLAVCDRYQNLHILWGDNTEFDNWSAFFYITDQSGKFSNPEDILLTQSTIHSPAIAISPITDRVHLFWMDGFMGSMYYSSAALRDMGDPRSWQSIIFLDSRVHNPAIKIDNQGILHLIYGRAVDRNHLVHELIHMISTDDGKNWSSPKIIFEYSFVKRAYIRTEVAIDNLGRIHIGLTSRSQKYGLFSEVGYLRSVDGGKTWDSYKLVEKVGLAVNGLEWIAPYTFDNNEVHLTWHDPKRMHMVSYDGGTTWSEPVIMLSLGGAFGGPNELARDSDGNIYAVLAVNGGVFLVTWDNGKWIDPELIDGRPVDAHGQHIVICQGNQAHVVYYDRTDVTTSWYSSKFIQSQHIRQQVIPTQKITENAQPKLLTTSVPTKSPSITPNHKLTPYTDLYIEKSSPVNPLNYSLLTISLMLLGVLLIFLVRRKLK